MSDKGHSFGEVVLAHGGLEVGEGLVLGFGLASAPVHKEADHQPAEHAQDPQGIGAANSAAVLIERHIQALMSPVLDSPSQAICLEPVCCIQSFGWQVGNEAHRFVFASEMLPGQQGGLSGEGKAALYSPDGSLRPEAARLVDLRYFVGLGHQEAADIMGVSRRQADVLWAYARAWLYEELKNGE